MERIETETFTYRAANRPKTTGLGQTVQKTMNTSRRSLMVHGLVVDGERVRARESECESEQ